MSRELELVNFETAHLPRPYVNALVRPYDLFTPEQRLQKAREVGWNVFEFPSEMLQGGDLLSDSGTTTLTVEQFAALVKGDEAYGKNRGYSQLLKTFEHTFGIDINEWQVYLFHQCRAAEDALYSHVNIHGACVLANNFFDTTRANAEAHNVDARDLPDESVYEFKGNINLEALEHALAQFRRSIPFVLMTITNNTNAGQPASMENLKNASFLAHGYGTSFFLDACRFAENAWFIQKREKGYEAKTIVEIVHEMFALCDGFTISFKKDGLANMGGALMIRKNAPLFTRVKDLHKKLRRKQTRTEGHHSYGGISGKDIMTIVEGLPYAITNQFLDGRIAQVRDFGTYMKQRGIPVIEPFGGHAVYVDVDKFFADTTMRREDFGGISLTALLLLKGVRGCELGAFAFGKYYPEKDTETLHLDRNCMRLAVPRNALERDDLDYVVDCAAEFHQRRHELPRAIPVTDRDEPLRHMTARFELKYR